MDLRSLKKKSVCLFDTITLNVVLSEVPYTDPLDSLLVTDKTVFLKLGTEVGYLRKTTHRI